MGLFSAEGLFDAALCVWVIQYIQVVHRVFLADNCIFCCCCSVYTGIKFLIWMLSLMMAWCHLVTPGRTACGNYGERSNICQRSIANPVDPKWWEHISEDRCKLNCIAQGTV